ncbi:MAG: PilZ domain-containing protein [Sphingomonadales bacterium]|nr:PilZ domain-containing protein [Sphingomonadales bacterium]
MGFTAPPRLQPGSRSINRLRLGVPARLALTIGTERCLLDDISAIGARLRLSRALPKGQTAVLNFHELRIFGSVVWWRNGECGLRFDRPLDLEDMQGMLWITENRDLYDRICRESRAEDWSAGIGE